ncbi:hypothetical protein EFR00_32315 [Rhizobium sophoriradicis]|uniref:metallophosphoesterase n=1 Tax=Rhizobium sophoriradicis TaxID=1535245 RepID=UPI00098F4EF4|nr:metallophosphoesterase [Rhizobium sophoriradicis]RSB79875.1 hypothetical protein EFR00_32315 [Rhizobium sophoriradicis]
MTDFSSFKLLHLSDLHAGMHSQKLLWPNVKEVFFEDLKTLAIGTGPWDAVLFSGDFAQKGAKDEFDEVVSRLQELWGHFKKMGFRPSLICIPGNHDIERPDGKSPTVKVLKRWFENSDIWEDFFSEPVDPYRRTVVESLSNYNRFISELASTGIPLLNSVSGLMPGDQLLAVRNDKVSLGVLGLNSTWLQLSGDDYKGKLALDHRQVHALSPSLGNWCGENHFNIVVTHHPLDWLHQEHVRTWNSEISPPGRFDLHLFGHMHEPFSETVGISGALARASMQAPSLFGMETFSDNKAARIHGYNLLSFEASNEGRQIRIWPRRLLTHKSGQHRFVAETEFLLEDDKFFRIPLAPRTVSAVLSAETAPSTETFEAESEQQTGRDVLAPLNYHLTTSQSHLRVRLGEQQQCAEHLDGERALWLTSEWGLGSDEFIASVLSRSASFPRVYRLDASEYSNKDEYSAAVARKLGCSFAGFCDALETEASLLILDDITTGIDPSPGTLTIEQDIESFVNVIRDACPKLRIVLRALRKPSGNTLPLLVLAPLDEADVKLYVGDHERGDSKLTTIEAIAILFRHTDGYPSRLEARLKELAVVSLEELSSGDGDAASGDKGHADAPAALKYVLGELSSATEKASRRMFDMLQTLIVFPQGAEFGRIKRFNGVHPFHPSDALGLMDRALITVSETPDMGGPDGSASQKILVVPRPIRDYLRTQLAEERLDSLNMRAAALLFGPDWMAGSKDWPTHLDYSSSKCGNADIANASALLIRLFRIHRERPQSRESIAIVSLAASFAAALSSGAHFTSCANFCRDFIALMGPDDNEEKRAHLIRQQAYAMRMLGESERAKELYEEIEDFPFTKDTRQHLLIELALCYKASDGPRAMRYAGEALKINRHNSLGFQAQSIIAEQALADHERTRKLIELEKAARRKRFFIVADNIALILAEQTESDDEASALLANVLGRRGDSFYNQGRAVLELAERKIDAGTPLSHQEVTQLIGCYQFLLNERVPWMLNKCHKLLWHVFSERRDWFNLLTLFRYSSMIWRLRGEEYREEDYLMGLRRILEGAPVAHVRQHKVSHYYYARLDHHSVTPKIASVRKRIRKSIA